MERYFQIYITILTAGVLVGIFRFNKLSKSSRWSATLLFVTILSEVIAQYLAWRKVTNHGLYHFLIPIQFVLVTLAFNSELKMKLLNGLILLFLCFCVAASFSFAKYPTFPSHQHSAFCFLVIYCCLLYLSKLLERPTEFSFAAHPLFWVSCGWLLYCVLNLCIFGLFKIYSDMAPSIQSVLNNIRYGANYFLYICYILALLSSQRILNASK